MRSAEQGKMRKEANERRQEERTSTSTMSVQNYRGHDEQSAEGENL